MLDEETQKALIDQGRRFMHGPQGDEYPAFESDQELKRPQPALVKPAMSSHSLALQRNFDDLPGANDSLLQVMARRRSARVYTRQALSQLQLSFLLWATQGIRAIRGKSYATLRTVPSGGARHGYETYLLVRQVEGLEAGAYHYLPLTHALEFLGPLDDPEKTAAEALDGQRWAGPANVIFFWAAVPYRFEWRYGIHAHRPALMDVGHIAQNLYLACTALGLGTCAVAAFDQKRCDALFGLDGTEEFTVYCAPVGTVSEADKPQEDAFYRFVQEQGL